MRAQVVGGANGQSGVEAQVRVLEAAGLNDGSERESSRGVTAFRAVPLLRMLGEGGDRVIVVGQVHVKVGTGVELELHVQATWLERTDWAPGSLEDLSPDLLIASLERPAHSVPAPGRTVAGRQRTAAILGKALTEGSRNAVAELRSVRYGLESRLADDLRHHRRGTGLLAQIVELALAVNRARDQAREAAREGLWLWCTDDEAYQSYRKAQDPELISDVPPADSGTRPWMRTHDAGVRQCRGMEALLAEEAALLYDLLGGASTVEASREADAQEGLNQLLTVAGVGLGLPALLLTLYGVKGLTPPNNSQRFLSIAFIAVATAAAGTAAVVLAPRLVGQSRLRVALVAVIALAMLLVVAGQFAPPP